MNTYKNLLVVFADLYECFVPRCGPALVTVSSDAPLCSLAGDGRVGYQSRTAQSSSSLKQNNCSADTKAAAASQPTDIQLYRVRALRGEDRSTSFGVKGDQQN